MHLRRPPVVLFVLLASTSVACRSTHEADGAEMETLNGIAGSLELGSTVAEDQGQAGVGAIHAILPLLQGMSDPDNDRADASSFALVSAQPSLADVLERGGFKSRARAAWPECVQQGDGVVEYVDCDYSSSSDPLTIDFVLDGRWEFTDTTSDSELSYNLSLEAGGIGLEQRLSWQGHTEWSERILDGDFLFEYASGVEMGALTVPLGSVHLRIDARFEMLEFEDTCESAPIGGSIDWKSVLRDGIDSQRRHVTIEFTGCGSGRITW
jgi:hypothetical protein